MIPQDSRSRASSHDEDDPRDNRVAERDEGLRHQLDFLVLAGLGDGLRFLPFLDGFDSVDKRVVLAYCGRISHVDEDTASSGAEDAARVFSWTPPGEIDGTPEEVRELTINQLRDFALVGAELISASHTQILAADLGDLLDEDEEDAVARWYTTPRGRACVELRRSMTSAIRAVKAII